MMVIVDVVRVYGRRWRSWCYESGFKMAIYDITYVDVIAQAAGLLCCTRLATFDFDGCMETLSDMCSLYLWCVMFGFSGTLLDTAIVIEVMVW